MKPRGNSHWRAFILSPPQGPEFTKEEFPTNTQPSFTSSSSSEEVWDSLTQEFGALEMNCSCLVLPAQKLEHINKDKFRLEGLAE